MLGGLLQTQECASTASLCHTMPSLLITGTLASTQIEVIVFANSDDGKGSLEWGRGIEGLCDGVLVTSY